MSRKAEIEAEIKFLSDRIDSKMDNIDYMRIKSFKELESYYIEDKRKIDKLNAEYKLLLTPIITESVRDDDLMTIEDFVENCLSGGFINYDGWGYYSDGVNKYDMSIRPSDVTNNLYRKDFTHIV